MLVWIAAERVYGTTKLCDYAILGLTIIHSFSVL